MKWSFLILFSEIFSETNGLRLRGIFQQREKMLEGKASKYFLNIYRGSIEGMYFG